MIFFKNKKLRYNRNLGYSFLWWYLFIGLFFLSVVIFNSKQVDFMNAVTKMTYVWCYLQFLNCNNTYLNF